MPPFLTRALNLLLLPGQALFAFACRRELKLFKAKLNRAEQTNREVLRQILRYAAATEFGRSHDFSRMAETDEPGALFAKKVAVSQYADYRAAIQRIREGAADVLFPGRPRLFVSTSGTSGDAKLYPMTGRQQRSVVRYITMLTPAVRAGLHPQQKLFPRTINLMLASRKHREQEHGIPVGMSSAGGLSLVLPFTGNIWVSPPAVFQLDHHTDALYLHALFGLLDESVSCIEAIFASHVLSWVSMIQQRRQALLDDIRHGTLCPSLTLSAAQRRRINARLQANPQRADQLATIFAEGEDGLLQRLWPKLTVINTIVSGSFAVNLPRLNLLKGNRVSVYNGCFGATEAMIGINLEPEQPELYTLAIDSCYFEFLPVDEAGNCGTTAVGLSALATGHCYELVISNFAGLYRYRLDDVIQVAGFTGDTPLIRFAYRRGTMIDLAGEKTTEQHALAALDRMARQLTGAAASIAEYSIHADLEQSPYRYRVYLELADTESVLDTAEASALLDEALQQANPSYRTLARSNNRLAPLQVMQVAPGTFAELQEALYQSNPALGRNQVKIPRRIQRPEQLAILQRNVIQPA